MAARPTPGKVIEIKVNDSLKMKRFVKNGVAFPVFTNDELLDSFQEFIARDDDVWICGYPKAGTHWLWEVVSMLLYNNSELSPLPKEHTMAEAMGATHLEELPSPRVLNSHFPVHFMPSAVWKKDNKIIYIIRNPKDSLVSQYFHNKNAGSFGKDVIVTLHEFYKAMYSPDNMAYDGWLKYNIEWQKKQKDNSSILLLKYEDVHKDHLGTVRTIATFLDCTRDEDVFKNIQEKTSFKNMQQNKVSNKAHPKTEHMDNFSDETGMFRKGKVGDWKNHFTVALNEEFDKDYEERIESNGLIVQLN